MKLQTVKKNISLFLVAAIILPVLAMSASAFVPENAAEDDPALTVYFNGNTYTLSEAELRGIADAEGGNAYTYSAFNTYPTWSTVTGTYGPSIKGVFEEVGIDFSAMDNNVITFTATDNYTASITAGSLFADRYYFPNGEGSIKGGFSADSAFLSGKALVPAIINLNSKNQLLFGQKAPNEITSNSFNKNMIGGSITVGTDDAGQYTAPALYSDIACTTAVADNSDVAAGSKLYFLKEKASEARVYYTVSAYGEVPADPTINSYMYDTSDKLDENKSPFEVPSDKKLVIKAVVIGRGKADSEVVTYYLNGASKFTSFFAGIYVWVKALYELISDYVVRIVDLIS